jgi:NADPH:quinone reductase-like Zn-dependent oxidoreductase
VARIAEGEGRHVRAEFLVMSPSSRGLAEIVELADAGEVRPECQVLSLTEAFRAHEMMESGHTRGKIVLSVGG